MATLYEIDSQITQCIDSETGEMIDAEKLESLLMERDAKIEAVALWIKNLQSDALAFKAEKDAFAEREKSATKKAEQLKAWLSYILGGEKFSTSKCAVSFRRSVKTEVFDSNIVPAQFMVEKTTVSPDLTAIKEAIKNGEEVSGCRLVESLNTQIK